MNISIPIDIEEEIRLALTDYITVYVRPLPDDFSLPCLLITHTGGNTSNTIDTFTVSLGARANTDYEAEELLRTAIGILEKQAETQFNRIRNVSINSLASWSNDPARPDLKLCTATVLVTAHRESFNFNNQ